jgi:branched-chain amino acid transport system substrate-binding protein
MHVRWDVARRGLVAAALMVVMAVVLAACGSDSSSSSNDASGGSGGSTTTTKGKDASSSGELDAEALWAKGGSGKCGSMENFVDYVCGKPGAADPSKTPVKIGWVNNQGGSIVSLGPQATQSAQMAVDWVNKYAGGIGGHKLELATCFVKNSEEEGKACADQYLADKSISMISYGAVGPGANTINAAIKSAGIPVIEGFAINASDTTSLNHFILFTATPFDFYAFGTFGRDVLKAKTGAIVYAQGTGFQQLAAAAAESMKAVGMKVKSVGFDPNSTNLVGAMVAAGAQTADMIVNVGGTPATCIAINKAQKQLKIADDKFVSDFACALESEKAGYGGDIPKWYFGQAQSGDGLTDSPIGKQYLAALSAFGHAKDRPDVWYSGMFGTLLTIAQTLNKVGPDKLSPETIKAQIKQWRGPLLLGEPKPFCGKYPSAPANCGGGNRFFRYQGDGKWAPVSQWTDVPIELQKKLGAKGVQ